MGSLRKDNIACISQPRAEGWGSNVGLGGMEEGMSRGRVHMCLFLLTYSTFEKEWQAVCETILSMSNCSS